MSAMLLDDEQRELQCPQCGTKDPTSHKPTCSWPPLIGMGLPIAERLQDLREEGQNEAAHHRNFCNALKQKLDEMSDNMAIAVGDYANGWDDAIEDLRQWLNRDADS
jgi:hypothetical protein